MMENLTVVDVLLVEDDPGDVVLIKEAFEFNRSTTRCTSPPTAWSARLPPPAQRARGRTAT